MTTPLDQTLEELLPKSYITRYNAQYGDWTQVVQGNTGGSAETIPLKKGMNLVTVTPSKTSAFWVRAVLNGTSWNFTTSAEVKAGSTLTVHIPVAVDTHSSGVSRIGVQTKNTDTTIDYGVQVINIPPAV